MLERGDIAFFYRPRVQAAGALVYEPGVQRFFLVLSPEGSGLHRRLRIGRKRMPGAARERFWAQVERVGSFERVVADQLEDEQYSTRTRGDRYQPGARPIGQGSYAFVQHDDHSHLAYRIEHVEPLRDIPEEVRIPAAASHLVLYERSEPGRAVWTAVGTPAQLDEEGAEIVMVGAEDEPERQLGIDILA